MNTQERRRPANETNLNPENVAATALRIISPAILALAISSQAHAQQNGTWTSTASGLWSDSANWSGGNVANGSGFTANFNTVNIPAATTVNLDSARTIGSLIFGDTDTTSAASWTLANNGSAANILTLAGGTPTITVNALGASSTATVSAVIAGTSGLTKDGAGILILSAANTYSGGTSITAGFLGVSNSSALGTGSVAVSSGGRLQLQNVSLSNNISLSGANAIYIPSGNNTINGSLSILANSSTYNTSATNNTLVLAGGVDLGGNVLTISSGGGGSSTTISSQINGNSSSGLTKTNSALLAITGNNSATYSGTTSHLSGSLALGNNDALGTGLLNVGSNDTTVTVRSTDTTTRTIGNAIGLLGNASSIFSFGSGSAAFNGNLNFTNTGSVALGTAARRFSINNRTEFSSAFTGTGGITMQTGTGTMVMRGTSNYSGATTLNAGTMLVSGSLSSTGTVAVNSSATLGGAGGSVGAVTVTSGGNVAPGDGGIGSLSMSSLDLEAGSNLRMELNVSTLTTDVLSITGAFNLATSDNAVLQLSLVGSDTPVAAGTTFSLLNYGSWNGARFTYQGSVLQDDSIITLGSNSFVASYNGVDGATNSFTLTAVPEPSVLTLGGLAALALLRRSRKANLHA